MGCDYFSVYTGTGWTAICTCGWQSPYTHAFQSYAEKDWEFHVNPTQPEPRQA